MKRVITLWALLGTAYVALETLWRGYSHPSMFIVGGLCTIKAKILINFFIAFLL